MKKDNLNPKYPSELTNVFGKDASKMIIIQTLTSIEEKAAQVCIKKDIICFILFTHLKEHNVETYELQTMYGMKLIFAPR